HARRTPGLAGAAQLVQQGPRLLAQQADHDLAVGKGRVVVGNLPQARCCLADGRFRHECLELGWCVHEMRKGTAAKGHFILMRRWQQARPRFLPAPPGVWLTNISVAHPGGTGNEIYSQARNCSQKLSGTKSKADVITTYRRNLPIAI